MCIRRLNGLMTAVLAIALVAGCKKQPAQTKDAADAKPPVQQPAPVPETVARLHWLGMKELLSETNAAFFKTLWEMPETARLETQTLDKLALAPWRQSLPALQPQVTNSRPVAPDYRALLTDHPFASLLRPLLEDLVQEEVYLEARQVTNEAFQIALAVRLDDARAAAWQTNLAAVLGSVSGTRILPSQAASSEWSLEITNLAFSAAGPSPRISCSRAGTWTLLGLAPQQNSLLADFASRIQSRSDRNPFDPGATNHWLKAEIDLPRLWKRSVDAGGLQLPIPQVSLSVNGDGKDVQTRGALVFSEALPIQFEPWNVPTNLLHEELDSSSGFQGIVPWLASMSWWKDLELGEPPQQLYWWSRLGVPFQTYCAAPMTNVQQFFEKVAGLLLKDANPWLATNSVGYLEKATNGNTLIWKTLPFMVPRLETVTLTNGAFVLAGFANNTSTSPPPSAETLHGVVSRTNVIYYDWELTGPRIEELLYLGQLLRVVFHKSQLPTKCISVPWLKALEPKLRDCRTVVTRTQPDQLVFARNSGLGLTAFEIHLLVDWLESPQFPYGLHTFVVPKTPPRQTPPAADARGGGTTQGTK